jgi:23S rRNA (cytidine1920-2'-O)/16S rRNA (cytidine1409-2'-O)-methyltransferase
VGKKGVVRDRKVHEEVIETVTAMTVQTGFSILGLDYSPIRGPEGNIEYLMYIRKPAEGEEASPGPVSTETIQRLVAASHESLDRQQA